MEGLEVLFASLMVFLIVILIVGFVFYLLMAIGLYRIARTEGFDDLAFLAWIPIAQLFLVGKIAEEVSIFGVVIPNLHVMYPVLCLVFSTCCSIPYIGFIFAIVYTIFTVSVYARILEPYREGVIKWVFAFFAPIGFFIISREL